jgi:hypothetical protein
VLQYGNTGDISDISSGDSSHDVRDIAWKQLSRLNQSTEIPFKNRSNNKNQNILLISITDESWDFCVEQESRKSDFYKVLDTACRYSTSQLHLSYRSYQEGQFTIFQKLKEEKIQNSLIIVVSGILDTTPLKELISIVRQNDVIFLHLFHPHERGDKNEKSILIEGMVFSERYKKEFEEARKKVEEMLRKNNCSYLQVLSEESPILLLNHFFRNRYAH